MKDMENKDQIRPLTDVPDHGFGLLGSLTHNVLAEYAGVRLTAPRLHLGQNTLPNPPFPLAVQVPFGDLARGWRECGEDLTAFLEAGARMLRTQPTPDISVFSQYVRILQRVLRFDSIAMVWEGWMIRPTDSVATWSLAADLPARRHGPWDCNPVLAPPQLLTVTADRAGNALFGCIPAGTRRDIRVIGDSVTRTDRIVILLRDVLLAQYAWTSAVFGVVP